MNNLGNFPLELIQLIVTFIRYEKDFVELALINKTFNVAVTRLIWYSPKTASLTAYLQLSRTNNLHPVPLGHHIRQLLFSRDVLLPKEPNFLFTNVPLLKHITLDHQTIPDPLFFTRVSQHCPMLSTIHLTGIDITDNAISPLGSLPLRTFAINTCPRLTYKTLASLKYCPLESLEINNCQEMICRNSALGILDFFPQLVRLLITALGTDSTTDFMQRLLTPNALTMLKEIGIKVFLPCCIDNTLLIPFITSHPSLHTIHLSGCRLNDHTLSAMHGLSRLEKLDLGTNNPLSHHTIRLLIKHCARLSLLNLVDYSVPKRYFINITHLRARDFYRRPIIDRVHNTDADDDLFEDHDTLVE